jgi:predicted nucleic acid-binding protein
MMNYLLDTNHVASLVTIGHPLRKRIFHNLEVGDTFAIHVLILAEMLFGIGILPRAQQNLAEWVRLKSNFTCYLPDETDAERAAELQISLRRQGWQLETVDAFIAVTALRYNLTLLTTDNDFQAVPELLKENWKIPVSSPEQRQDVEG